MGLVSPVGKVQQANVGIADVRYTFSDKRPTSIDKVDLRC